VTANDPRVQQAAAQAENYIVTSKNWEKGSFQVELNRKEGTTLVFWVLHSGDRTATTTPGGGKSVEVHVDPISNRVLRELAFQ
jgi:hypothetical protein